MRDRRLTQAATVEDTAECRFEFLSLKRKGEEEMNRYVARLRKLAFLAFAVPTVSAAQLFPVSQIDKSSPDPTMTFLYESKAAKATLVFIQGGLGNFGVKSDWDASNQYFASFPFNLMLKRLSDPKETSGNFNVVIFDNPTRLPVDSSLWSAGRGGADHLTRIESVIAFYKEKFGKPVWLMGHSAGTTSITEYSRYLQDNKKEGLVAGYIHSSGVDANRPGIEKSKLPILLIHHEKDGCFGTTPSGSQKVFEKVKEAGNSAAEFVLIKTGESQQDPCRTGHHMYFGSSTEVAKVVDQFLTKHTTLSADPKLK